MGFLKRHADHADQPAADSAVDPVQSEQKITGMAIFLGLVASIGGFMFGYVR
jgi:MFS transporter, SP family, sugar:H+ symporter